MTPPPPPFQEPERFVVVWRETRSQAARLRTYTDASDTPIAYAAEELSVAPATLLPTTEAVDQYLQSDAVSPVLIPIALARSVLGWSPRTTLPT